MQASTSVGPDWSSVSIIQGQYTAVLQAGGNPYGAGGVNASLSQIGLVPTNANSILVEIAGGNFVLSFAGQTIPLSAIQSGPNYTLYGGDISLFAGQVGELRVSTLSPSGSGFLFDAITFSSEAIPEPLSVLLTTFGALLLWPLLKRKRA
jgi:hypothetical protein